MMALPHVAHARVVDRIAAVVGPHVIFLSEVVERAGPDLQALAKQDPLARAKGEAKVLHDTCEGLVDEWLVQQEAERIKASVTEAEVDDALQQVAKNSNMTVEALLQYAKDSNLPIASYRASLRAQILVYRIARLRNPTAPGNLENEVKDLKDDLRHHVWVDVRLQ